MVEKINLVFSVFLTVSKSFDKTFQTLLPGPKEQLIKKVNNIKNKRLL